MPRNNINYTTDMAHCMGGACAIRDKCYRYWLRKELRKKAINGFICPPHIEEQYDLETEECEMYKPIKQYGKCNTHRLERP